MNWSADAADSVSPSVAPELVEAFEFPGTRRPPCLLIHGFTGTPYEVRSLGRRLSTLGHRTLGVRLAGHGRTPEELEKTGWPDWYRDVERGARQLVRDAGPLIAIGMSAGSLLALHLAYERPSDVRGLVLMAPAVRLSDWRARWLIPLVGRLPALPERFRFIPKRTGSDISNPEARRVHPGYRKIPITSAFALTRLQRQVWREIPAISKPTLILHGALDRTCPPSNAGVLAAKLGRPPLRTFILPASAHVITVDDEREHVEAAVAKFVTELAADAGTST